MLLDVEPTHVCEEEPAHGIVRVGISLRVFVVDSMIASPVVDRTLVGDGVAQHEKEADGEGGGVGAVRPQAMDADGYTEATTIRQTRVGGSVHFGCGVAVGRG